MKKCLAWIALNSLLLAGHGMADVRMPHIFGAHMVLQQDGKIPVWGWADAGEEVTVKLGDLSAKTTAGPKGEWRVDLPPVPATPDAQTLVVTGKNTLSYPDVLIGDVWLCSGQSNMEWPLGRSHLGKEDIPNAIDPQIRFFQVPKNSRSEEQSDVEAKWVVCSPQAASGFSAVAYYFAQDLRKNLNRPIGLIGSYWGGTPAQAWTSLPALQKQPPFPGYVDQAQKNLDYYLANKDAYPALLDEYKLAKQKWDTEVKPVYEPALKAWKAEAKAAKDAGAPSPPKPAPSIPEPKAPRDPNPGPNSSALFNGMISPLIPYSIKGAIWYQGESNANNADEYRELFSRMITDWRSRWERGNFPFLFVQLASYGGARGMENYPGLREQQLKTLSLANTGMAVAIDIGAGKDIHPADKKDVGLRLALSARHVAYGEKLVHSGPLYQAMRVQGSKVVLAFQHNGGGLKTGAPPWQVHGAPPVPTGRLSGFTICGADRQWVSADAKIEDRYVIVSSPQISLPVAVRYGWEGDPVCNLYNQEDLPASPFRTDDWPRSTEPDDANSKKFVDWYAQCTARVAAAKGKRCDVIFIGDSITQNWTEEKNPAMSGKATWDKRYAPLHALNFGVGADSTRNMIWRLDHMDVKDLRPKVAVILAGTNNTSDTPADIAAGVKAIVDRTRSMYPGVKILLNSIMPTARESQRMAAANEILSTFADSKSVFYLDLKPYFPPVGNNWKGLNGDRLHPNPEGYEVWANAMDPLLNKLLGR